MLAQFQARYPTGSLISELLHIYQGKFIVRVAATVEGVTRATGMAAAETLEVAEDRARSRALAVLLIQQSPSTQSVAAQPVTSEMQLQPGTTASSQLPSSQANLDRPFTPTAGLNDAYSSFSPASPQVSDALENLGMMSGTKKVSSQEPPIPFGNVTPMVSRRSNPEDSLASLSQTREADREKIFFPRDPSVQMEMGDEVESGVGEGVEGGLTPLSNSRASEPADLSDAIARTSVELKRLGWDNQKGRDYLQKTYGKLSRQHLTDSEMLEFLEYLQSQPSPKKP